MSIEDLKKARDEKQDPIKLGLTETVELLEGSSWEMLALSSRLNQPIWRSAPPCKVSATKFPTPVCDTDAVSVVVALREQGYIVNKNNAYDALVNVASRRPFDPVAEYLRGLEWDGKPRIGTWLADYFGAVADSEELERWHREIGRRWLISAVARTLRPGCKVDTMLIAEGEQGARKSSAFAALMPDREWFAEDPPSMNNPIAATAFLQGPWIIEMDELEQLSKRDVETVKSFLSKKVDRTTMKWKKLAEDFPRRVVFCGTTNEEEYLLDATGGRRFWSFAVTEAIDVDGIAAARDQLWAEAVHEFEGGAVWWLDDPELLRISKDEQEQRYSASAFEEPIEKWLNGEARHRDHVTTGEVLLECLCIPIERVEQKHQRNVAKVLRRLGWAKKQVRTGCDSDPNGGTQRVKCYVRPGS